MNSSRHDHDDPPSIPSQQQQQQAATTTSASKQPPKKRAKTVTFSEDVLSQSNDGGSKVVIREERGVFLGPLLGRMVISSDESAGDEEDDGDVVPRRDCTDREKDEGKDSRREDRVISFDVGTVPPKDSRDAIRWNGKPSSSVSSSSTHSFSTADDNDVQHRCPDSASDMQIQHEESQGRSVEKQKNRDNTTTTTTYDNLVIKMGLLKCGHRYRVVVPVPDDVWKNSASAATNNDYDGSDDDASLYETNVRIVEDSLDDDLRGVIELQQDLSEEDEIEANDGDCEGEEEDMALDEKNGKPINSNRKGKLQRNTAPTARLVVDITLSARRRGPYRGRFVLESTRQRRRDFDVIEEAVSTQPTTTVTENAAIASPSSLSPSINDKKTAKPSIKSARGPISTMPTYYQKKCIMSIQVDATIMGKDMGTPKLRNGVTCLGKIVGYDSDEETEWQGFD